MEEESETFEPVTFRITGYMQDNEEVRFSYDNCRGITYPIENIFKEVHIVYENENEISKGFSSLNISVIKYGKTDINIFKARQELSGVLSVKCEKKDNQMFCSATFNGFSCIII